MSNAEAPANFPTARDWRQALTTYHAPSHRRSVLEIVVTLVPFVLLWIAMWWTMQWSYWLSIPICVLASGFLVRLFMIQHDCGHSAFFRQRQANDWTGRAISILTLTPYDDWRRSHATHHATSGNLDRRGIGDITTLTVTEYLALPLLGRIRYRLYRNPIVMFVIGPAYLFLIQHRFPATSTMRDWRAWISPMLTNAVIALVAAPIIWLVGLSSFLMVQIPIIVVASSIGVWLFYVQHQFESTTWAKNDEWSVHEAALHGSSHYDLPPLVRWLTANIGVHHVHHLSSRIPYYRLSQVLEDHPELKNLGRVTFLESLACVRLTLWDEARHRLISFRQLRALNAAAA